ncbi:isocitrate lyase/PEP mutase family protein [Jiella endophytica]|uniref:Isocitrate lyase/PEP mutase family protein n=1 Tax=Jiella endophytica TaxID=2558362 RepID=A0A4Y8RHF9_9HYPH|nr:isocitrate lyase/PEP mutase family protein [Jiella endophytica]TFF21856.1 isocitrate lyase/PEP mutase family protein [Jiella endophytica]
MSLKARLSRDGVVVAPGVYDPLTALIATDAGFEALYLSGAGVAYTRLGRSDIGLATMSEMTETIQLVRDRVETPMIVDADNGHGNALNVQRTVRLYERAGASALQLEDQSLPKRCGHLSGKKLVTCGEMVGKIKAAVDARKSEETLIVARTDAIAVDGFDAAIERAERYVEAGADILFVEAPRDEAEVLGIATRFSRRLPLLANMVEGGSTPLKSADDLGEIGFKVVIFPGGIVRAIARTAQDYYRSLHQHRTNKPFKDRMFDFDGLNAVIGTPELLALGERYEDPAGMKAGGEE